MKIIFALCLFLAVNLSARADWDSKAKKDFDKMMEGPSRQALADSCVSFLHPTATTPKLEKYEFRDTPKGLSVAFTFDYTGQFSKKEYQVQVYWTFSDTGHIKAEATSDAGPFPASQPNIKKMDDYFRLEVYPVLYSNVKKTLF